MSTLADTGRDLIRWDWPRVGSPKNDPACRKVVEG